jgi:hypothetical protein
MKIYNFLVTYHFTNNLQVTLNTKSPSIYSAYILFYKK